MQLGSPSELLRCQQDDDALNSGRRLPAQPSCTYHQAGSSRRAPGDSTDLRVDLASRRSWPPSSTGCFVRRGQQEQDAHPKSTLKGTWTALPKPVSATSCVFIRPRAIGRFRMVGLVGTGVAARHARPGTAEGAGRRRDDDRARQRFNEGIKVRRRRQPRGCAAEVRTGLGPEERPAILYNLARSERLSDTSSTPSSTTACSRWRRSGSPGCRSSARPTTLPSSPTKLGQVDVDAAPSSQDHDRWEARQWTAERPHPRAARVSRGHGDPRRKTEQSPVGARPGPCRRRACERLVTCGLLGCDRDLPPANVTARNSPRLGTASGRPVAPWAQGSRSRWARQHRRGRFIFERARRSTTSADDEVKLTGSKSGMQRTRPRGSRPRVTRSPTKPTRGEVCGRPCIIRMDRWRGARGGIALFFLSPPGRTGEPTRGLRFVPYASDAMPASRRSRASRASDPAARSGRERRAPP